MTRFDPRAQDRPSWNRRLGGTRSRCQTSIGCSPSGREVNWVGFGLWLEPVTRPSSGWCVLDVAPPMTKFVIQSMKVRVEVVKRSRSSEEEFSKLPTCTAAPAEVPVEGVGKHSDEGGSEPSRKKTKVTVSKRLKKAALGEGSERAHRSKGKEPMKEATESPNHPPTVRELCEVDGWAGKDRYFVMQISELP
ncbi:hypothetical protein BHM03_00012079 [Ensete ventricosum]|nr:hypothetical protein BHM03_00012079 [Ensete ventricosum]